MVRWTVEARRRRLVARHHLRRDVAGPGGGGLAAVARDLVGLHASDPVTVFLQAHARVPEVTTDDVLAALYEDRSVGRVQAMRGTMFIVDPVDIPMLRAAGTDTLADRELRRTASWIEEDGLAADGQAWVRAAAADTLVALADHGPMTANQLKAHVPALAEGVVRNPGKSYGGRVGMSTRVLFWLATVGDIVRARPGGSITSTAWTWARTDDWLGAEVLAPADPAAAAAGLARRYLAGFGPATFDDLQWWTGWTKTLTRRALADTGAVEVEVEDGRGGVVTALVLAGDDEPPTAVDDQPALALLPALDATPMGWKERSWYLGEHTTFPGPLFDRNGNVGPTVWVDGRVVGGWTQRPDGEIAWRLFNDPPHPDADHAPDDDVDARIAAEAAGVASFLGDVRFTPRFPTPWQVELGG